MNLLITGGTGFFGRALLRHYQSIVREGDEFPQKIIVLSRDPRRFQAEYPELANISGVQFHCGDIQQRESLPWGESFSHILHAATDSTHGPDLSPMERFEQILEGTRNILDLAVATGVRRFLLTSSGGIYGVQPPDLHAIPEDWHGSPPLAEPSTAYSQAKRAAEHLCALYQEAHGIETVIARCFSFVGQDLPLDGHFAIGNFIRDALYRDGVTVSGDGTAVRSYLEQRDLSRWLMTLLRIGRSGHSYNVGSDHPISIGDLAHLIRDLLAPDKPVRIQGAPQSAGSRSRYVPDISKARTDLGLDVRIPLSQAILETAAAHTKSEFQNSQTGL